MASFTRACVNVGARTLTVTLTNGRENTRLPVSVGRAASVSSKQHLHTDMAFYFSQNKNHIIIFFFLNFRQTTTVVWCVFRVIPEFPSNGGKTIKPRILVQSPGMRFDRLRFTFALE